MPLVEGHSGGRFLTWRPERRPASGGDASKPTSHGEIGLFFNVSWGGDWPHSGHTLRVAIADVCPEACGKPCGNAPTENVPAEFIAGMFNQAPGFSCDSGLTSYCAENQPVAWFCPKVCGKYNECSFNMGAPANAGGAVVPATAAVAAAAAAAAVSAGPTAKEQMVADCMTKKVVVQ